MRKVIAGIGGIVAAASVALTLAGVSPAFASPAAKTVTGPEAITGAVYGKAAIANVPHIPLTFAGLVATTDRGFTLGGTANTHTLATPTGKLTVTGIGKQINTQTMNTKTCHFSYTSRQQFRFVAGKSTGAFAGASGPGAYQVYFAAYEPRYTSGKHKGECNGNAEPLAKGATARFLAAGVLTVS
jgi:hypothetical protein